MQSRKNIHRLLALFLASLVFFTSSGFSIDAHYCQNKLKRVSFVGKAKTCQQVAACKGDCTKKAIKSCHSKNDSGNSLHSEKGCCDNKTSFVKYDGSFPSIAPNIYQDFEFQSLAILYHPNLLAPVQLTPVDAKDKNYHPPPLTRDFPVLLQRFLC